MCSVRGIGVALRESTSTSSRSARSSSFCATPKRCSSSTITSPSSFGITSRLSTRCVPIRTSTLPASKSATTCFCSFGGAEARDHLDAHREVAVALAEGVPVLLGQHGRRDEHQRLLAVDGDREGSAHGDLGLAEADVAADEAIHRARRLEILLDGLDRGALVVGLAVRELGLEPLEPLVLELVGDARRLLAARVEREQLARQLAQARARAALQVLPRLAAELRERRRTRVGADVLRDLADLLVRDVEPVVAAEAEEEVVARDLGDRLRLEAEQLPDPVILVDDEVAGAQVGEALQRAAGRRGARAGTLAEDLRVGEQHEPEVAPDEAAAGRRDREEELRLVRERVAGLEHLRLDPAQQVGRAQRLAAVREGDHDPVAGADEAGELGLGLGETARRDRRPLRLERVRLPARERLELRAAGERDARGRPRPRPRAPRRAPRRDPAAGRAAGRGRPGPAPARRPRAASAPAGRAAARRPDRPSRPRPRAARAA